jgi:hypothetical protein
MVYFYVSSAFFFRVTLQLQVAEGQRGCPPMASVRRDASDLGPCHPFFLDNQDAGMSRGGPEGGKNLTAEPHVAPIGIIE